MPRSLLRLGVKASADFLSCPGHPVTLMVLAVSVQGGAFWRMRPSHVRVGDCACILKLRQWIPDTDRSDSCSISESRNEKMHKTFDRQNERRT